MLDERLMDDVCALAEKMSQGESLTIEEQKLYDDIQEDAEAYRAFCLYTAFIDVPVMYMDARRQNIERLSREKIDISRYVTGNRQNQRTVLNDECDDIKNDHYSMKHREISCEKNSRSCLW